MLFRVFVLVSLLAPHAFADFPMIRFWRGYAQDTATRDGFRALINERLIPETIEVGSRQAEDKRGLLFYSPFMPSWNTAKRFHLPEEMAILVYQSPEHYDKIRQTSAANSTALCTLSMASLLKSHGRMARRVGVWLLNLFPKWKWLSRMARRK
jgi:hypothetical protein